MPKKKVDTALEQANHLVELCGGDMELAEFLNKYLNNGRNAQKAYKDIHPEVTDGSAATLGWRMLKKVDPAVIMREFGLTENLYFTQLKEGVQATKWNDFTGEREPDHKTRKDYHDKMGKILGIEIPEQRQPTVAIQINSVVEEQKKKYDI